MSGNIFQTLLNKIKLRFFSNSNTTPPASQQSKQKVEHNNRMVSGKKTFQTFLPKESRIYVCVHCRAHLACHEDLISKSFQGSQGRAYLFNKVVNVGTGKAEERYLLTGLHAVADIYCESCKNTLGWKYEQAFESSQKYKEGKYIIELIHLIKDNGWDTLTTNSWDTTNNATSQSKSDYYRSFNSFNFFKFACKKFLDRGTSSPSSSSSCATQKSNTNSTSSLNASSSKKLLLSITN